jgi:hypothetical protein
VKGKVVSSN